MTRHLPFRFGVSIHHAPSKQAWVAKAQKAEALGYSTLLLPDHLINQLAPVAALTIAAEATHSLRVGSLVFGNDFRHPVLLARDVATLDVLSGGRVELGIGAGWRRVEYEQAGIPFDAPRVRVSRLEEAVRLLKGLFADGPVTFSGTYYQLTGLEGFPKPHQRPYPPLLIAGGGKRMLSLAGREATIVCINPMARADGSQFDMQDATAEATAQKIAWLREAADERFDELELANLVFEVVVTDDQTQRSHVRARGASAAIIGNQLLQGIYVLMGTVDQICEQVKMNRDHFGISYLIVFEKDMESFAPVVARLSGT